MEQPFVASSSVVTIYDIGSRRVPMPGLIITATALGSAQTFFTVPEPLNSVGYVEKLTVTNTTGTAATLTFHARPSGVTAGQVTEELDAFNVPANTTLSIEELIGGVYASGTDFLVFSGTNGSLTIRGTLRQER